MLTPKQEKFVQNLVKGMSQREAYKKSYNAKNMKDDTIDKRASELFNQGEILGRYNELIEKAQDEAIMSARERMIWLSNVVNGKVTQLSYGSNGQEYENEAYISDKLKSIDILNKMTGEYTTKVEGTITALQKDMNAVSDIASQMNCVSEDDVDVST